MASAPVPLKHIRNVLALFAPLWVGTSVLFAIIGFGVSMFSADRWVARQPLVLRDTASGAVDRMGRFSSQTELKAAQETILELARNPEVVSAALKQIGPPEGAVEGTWPTLTEVESIVKEDVNVVAGQGNEFGTSDMVYLTVQAGTNERAIMFCDAMFASVSEHLRTVRLARAESIIVELTHARDLARKQLDEATVRMQEVEASFGSDLGELRNLNDTISGDGTSRRTVEEIAKEVQIAQLELERQESLYELLVAGSKDPSRLLVSGEDLLTSQPSLQRLKDGLIDAQIEASKLAGTYTESHPRRRAAITVEREITERMLRETHAAIRSMQPVLTLSRDRVKRLIEKKDKLEVNLQRLADVRSGYSGLDAEMKSLTEQLGNAESALTEARANRVAAESTNLLSALGPPQVGDKPQGAPITLMTTGSLMAGLIFGLGMVFLVAPGPSGPSYGRRVQDFFGRRESDRDPVGARKNPKPAPNGVERRRVQSLLRE